MGRQDGVRESEVGIQLDGVFQELNGLNVSLRVGRTTTKTVSLQRFEGRSRGLLDRRIEFLNRGQRLSEPCSNSRGHYAQDVQHVLFARSLHLFACQRISTGAIHGVQANHVLAAQAPNRSGQDRRASRALANLASRIQRDAVAW